MRNITASLILLIMICGCSESESDSQACETPSCMDANVPASDQGSAADIALPADQGVGTTVARPERFEFTFVDEAEEQEQAIRVTNVGTAAVTLRDFAAAFSADYTLYWHRGSSTAPVEDRELVVRAGQATFPETIELEPDDIVIFTLTYAPGEGGQRGGHLSFQGERELRFPIEHSDDRPEFAFDPAVVNFGTVEVGQRQLMNLEVTNIGTAIATLESVTITGDTAFSISIEGRDPEVDTRALHNPDRDLEPGVGLEKYFDVLIRCLAETDAPLEAEIRIVSDATNGDITIPVRANPPAEMP
jgi:hypothetical protein